jgi:hypothetical protein
VRELLTNEKHWDLKANLLQQTRFLKVYTKEVVMSHRKER